MSKTAVISCRVDEEMLATLDRLAAAHDRSRAWLVHKLLSEAARSELKLLEDIEEGIADLDAGRSISHEELVALLEARYAGREAA
jgi:predicted transcriptional regulator